MRPDDPREHGRAGGGAGFVSVRACGEALYIVAILRKDIAAESGNAFSLRVLTAESDLNFSRLRSGLNIPLAAVGSITPAPAAAIDDFY